MRVMLTSQAELLRDTGADGFNGDCMGPIPRVFYDTASAH